MRTGEACGSPRSPNTSNSSTPTDLRNGFPRTLRVSTWWPVTRWRLPSTRPRISPLTATFLEAWTEFQHAASEDERQSLISRWKPEEVSRFLKSPDTERLVRNTAFAFFKPEDYPTHDMLQQMMLVAPFPEHDRDEINHMATLLAPWNEQRLVCGHSTLSLTGRIAHFDLTYIPESNKQLKELAGFLIANYGRQHIITLPRGKRKRVIFEEVARTLDIPGGEQLVSEFYAQLSKFSTWIISIVQQYSRFQQLGHSPHRLRQRQAVLLHPDERPPRRRGRRARHRAVPGDEGGDHALSSARASSAAEQVCRADVLPSRRSAAALRNDP